MNAPVPLPRDRWLEEVRRHLDLDRELLDSDDPRAVNQAEKAHYLIRHEPPRRRKARR